MMNSLAEMTNTWNTAARIRRKIQRMEIRPPRRNSKNASVTLEDLHTVHAETLARLEPMKDELEGMLCCIENWDTRAIMRLRYLDGHKPEQIADALGMCVRTVFMHMKDGKSELLRMFPGKLQA